MPVLIALIVALVVFFATQWLISRGRREYKAKASKFKATNAIPLRAARERALELLQDKRLFTCLEAQPNHDPVPRSMPSGIIELFQRYDRIEAVSAGNPHIERNLVGRDARQQPYKLVGFGMEGSDVEFDLAVRSGDEKLYEVYNNETPDPASGIYNSVFHWILVTAARSEGPV